MNGEKITTELYLNFLQTKSDDIISVKSYLKKNLVPTAFFI